MGHLGTDRSRRIGNTLRKLSFAKMQGKGCNLISRSSLEWLGFRRIHNSCRVKNSISSKERE